MKQTRSLQFAADGWVVTEGVLNGTQKGPMGPVKATGKPVALHFVDVFHVTPDGKLSGGHTYDDGLEPLVEVGAAPALPH